MRNAVCSPSVGSAGMSSRVSSSTGHLGLSVRKLKPFSFARQEGIAIDFEQPALRPPPTLPKYRYYGSPSPPRGSVEPTSYIAFAGATALSVELPLLQAPPSSKCCP